MTDIPVIEFVSPIPGFPSLRQFALVEMAEDGSLAALRSLEDPDVRFLVAPPALLFPDYAPEIDDVTADALGLSSAEDALVLVVVNPGPSLADTTVNLLAPVVVSIGTRRAQQVVLDDPELSVAVPLRAA